jgi:hypothetical protein
MSVTPGDFSPKPPVSGGMNRIASVPTLTIYGKPACTTCRKLRALLTERGVDFDSIDYHATGI